MKKKTLGRIALFTFALCMASTSLLSGTLAKYASESTGTGTVSVAQWSNLKFQNAAAEATFDFNLAATKEENAVVSDTQIAPGDKGSFTFTIGPAEVEYSYSALISGAEDVPVSFYSDEEMQTAWTGANERVLLANAGNAITRTVYWQWTPGTDATDTTLGVANGNPTFTIALSAVQELTPLP